MSGNWGNNRGGSGGSRFGGGGSKFGGGGRDGGRFGGGGGKKDFNGGANMRRPNWDNVSLQPFNKNFYNPHPSVLNRSPYEVEEYRTKHEITMSGLDIPNPIERFEEGNFPDYVMQNIKNQGYKEPTAIQAQGWPIAMSGKNLVGLAQTGSALLQTARYGI